MRDPRYPLAAALTQRDHARTRAQVELQVARQRYEQAAATLREAAGRVRAHEQLRHALLGNGTSQRTLGANLSRSGAYAARLQAELTDLRRQLTAAEQIVAGHQRAVRVAELALLDAHAQHEVIERHHVRFRDTARRALDKAQELEAEDQQWSRSARRE